MMSTERECKVRRGRGKGNKMLEEKSIEERMRLIALGSVSLTRLAKLR